MNKSLVLDEGVEPIAGYRLIRLLGRGGFGEVWEASAPGDFHVAMKFLRLDTREGGLEEHALEVIRHIRHGHLLDIQFATRVADCLVIAMPLCDQSLMDRLDACLAEQRPGVPRNELLRYMEELARAVDYLNEPRHRALDGSLVGVQHRDIKPHNVFLVGGSVRLADFGLAKILAATSASTQGSMSPSYAAPEVIQGQFSRWSDQYSLAATYCQLRTGRPPFMGDNTYQIVFAHVNTAPDLSGTPRGGASGRRSRLAKPPEERWPTCCAFVQALIEAAGEDDRRSSAPVGPYPGLSALRDEPPRNAASASHPPHLGGRRERFRCCSEGEGPQVPPRRAGWPGAGLVLVAAAVVVIPRLSRSGGRSPGETSPAPETTIPAHDPPVARTKPDPSTATPSVPPEPQPAVTVAPPKQITRTEPDPRTEIVSVPTVPVPTVPIAPPKQITNSIGMKLVLIAPGEFPMGSPSSDSDAQDDEKPQHTVRITQPFYLGATEVSQGQYRAVTGHSPSHFKESDHLPVEQVSWTDAIAFCEKLNSLEAAQLGNSRYRLPTEAEWEYACRGGSTARYSFGDETASLGEFAWYDGNSGGKTHSVAKKRPNTFNLYDMHGNVWEWCQDSYDKDYYGQSAQTDPRGPLQTAFRVGRGGSWNNNPQDTRSAIRSKGLPTNRHRYVGFRVARVESSR